MKPGCKELTDNLPRGVDAQCNSTNQRVGNSGIIERGVGRTIQHKAMRGSVIKGPHDLAGIVDPKGLRNSGGGWSIKRGVGRAIRFEAMRVGRNAFREIADDLACAVDCGGSGAGSGTWAS